MFQHGDARPALHLDGNIFSDCALHSHAVVLNIARKFDEASDDGANGKASGIGRERYGALDGKAIFAWRLEQSTTPSSPKIFRILVLPSEISAKMESGKSSELLRS
ncbi:hypothetical protein ACVWWG_005270 [Bradyrhizobium sp. LB7.2]